jgi:hypothetical protein
MKDVYRAYYDEDQGWTIEAGVSYGFLNPARPRYINYAPKTCINYTYDIWHGEIHDTLESARAYITDHLQEEILALYSQIVMIKNCEI